MIDLSRYASDPAFAVTWIVIDFEGSTLAGFPAEPIAVDTVLLRLAGATLVEVDRFEALMRPPAHAPVTAHQVLGQVGDPASAGPVIMADRIRIAIAQTPVTVDSAANGSAIRGAMRQAADGGARLVHFPEGALSGYAGAAKPHYAGWRIDWALVAEQLAATMSLAGELGVWVVVGGNHRLTGDHRPHNALWVIDDSGRLADRYDKRLLSHNEVTGFYTPGEHVCTFAVDGFTFGCLLCIEVNFTELWMQQADLGVDCVLFSSFSEDPIFEIIARGHAATTGCWVSMAVPAQCAPAASSALIGPHGYLLRRASPDGPDVVCVELDRTDADLDIALNKARPWRATARAGDIYATRRVTDARSLDRTHP